jgi:Protein of unknown function (DUF3179)
VLRAEAKGKPLHFDYDSMVGSNEVFKDRETGSRWQQTLAEAISGPLKGTHLQQYPFLLTQWGEWRKQHPDTLVLKPLPGYAERMPGMNQFINQQWGAVVSDKVAPKGAFGHDDRLSAREIIIGLEAGGESKAYPISALRKEHVVNDTIGNTPVLIVHQPHSDTTTAFDPRLRGRVLKFKAADAAADRLIDLGTHSTWNAYGRCLSGKLKGAQLKSLILEPEFWFAWSEFRPETQVYGVSNRR